MAELASINFKKSIPINTQHNDRTTPPSYLIDGTYECNRNFIEANALKSAMIEQAMQKYTEHTRQKFQAKSYEWSAVVNLKPSSTMQDLEKLAEHLQEKYGFQCYQIAIHRDEGHFENGEKIFNHHAHLEFITLDKKTGKNNFRRELIKPQTLRDMQSEVAEILQMQRGIDKRLSGAKRIEPRIYAKMKESDKAIKQEIITLKQKEIKERLEQERKAWIKEQGKLKEDYAKLRELANLRYNTIAELENKIKELNETINYLKKENSDLKAKNGSNFAENQKNDKNLYSTENVRKIIAFKSEIDIQAKTINKEINSFNTYLKDAQPKKLKEINTNTYSLYEKISNNKHLEEFFSFEIYTRTLKKAIEWLKEKGLNLQNTK